MKAKPRGLKYTDLCIYIDKTNYYRDANNNPTGLRELTSEEIENIYTYLYHIVYALSVKKRLLTKKSDYDIFCVETAGNLYMRLRSPHQDYTGENESTRAIKSILNYIKGSLGYMCITWREKNYAQVLSVDSPKEKEKAKCYAVNDFIRRQAGEQFDDQKRIAIRELINNLPRYFEQTVKESIFKKDKLSSYEILLSMYLSLLNSATLTQKYADGVNSNKVSARIMQQLAERDKFTINFSSNPIVTTDFIDIIMKKAFNKIAAECEEISQYISPSDTDIDNILDSAYNTYDTNQSGN